MLILINRLLHFSAEEEKDGPQKNKALPLTQDDCKIGVVLTVEKKIENSRFLWTADMDRVQKDVHLIVVCFFFHYLFI